MHKKWVHDVYFSSSEKDDISLYGTPKEEMAPPTASQCSSRGISVSSEAKPGWVRNQLQNIFQPTDNKLAMKLFGSKKALIQERVRQKAAGHWIIHPCSSFRYADRNYGSKGFTILLVQKFPIRTRTVCSVMLYWKGKSAF